MHIELSKSRRVIIKLLTDVTDFDEQESVFIQDLLFGLPSLILGVQSHVEN
jgi:hypothetical protein